MVPGSFVQNCLTVLRHPFSSLKDRSSEVLWGAMAAVLTVLAGCALSGAYLSYQTGIATGTAISVSAALEEARYAVASEESLERKYRLEPGSDIRVMHRQAGADMLAALKRARDLGAERALFDEISVLHQEYRAKVRELFQATDAGDSVRAVAIDKLSVDPVFDQIQSKVYAASGLHRLDAMRQLQALTEFQKSIFMATPIIFSGGIGLFAVFTMAMRRYKKESQSSHLREQMALATRERRFRSLVENTSDAVVICSPGGTVSYQSPIAEAAWGIEPDGLLGTYLLDRVHPGDRTALKETFEQIKAVEGSTKCLELQLVRSDDGWRRVELILKNLCHEPDIEGIVVTARDITERKELENQLTRQAFFDSLTGLPNRVLLRDRLDQALARAERVSGRIALLFLDLDNFKTINDGFGHQAGDQLLIEVAARLRSSVKGENTVARLGGDEFVVLISPIAGEGDALAVAEQIEQQFARPFRLEDRDLVVTASIGIALGTSGQSTTDTLLRDADVAMYRAKSGGKAQHVVFDTTMATDAIARLELETALRQAISNNELRVHFQPIVILGTGKVAEVEALVRWQHPKRGLIGPDAFIEIAEETGLIIPLGQWVLSEACRQAKALQLECALDQPMILNVNLSPRQFQHADLVEDIQRVLRETGFEASNLKLEITEGVIMRDVETTIDKLWRLKGLGIQLAVDDFGTGYSSLAYLKRLPLDVLKIDRSFVDGIGDDHEDTAIVRAIILMAKSLNLSITAEGIERQSQSDLLREWSCDRGQGYYYARPLCAADLKALLVKSNSPSATTSEERLERTA